MRIVTQTERFVARLGEEEGVRALCRAGYEGLDFTMFDLKLSAFGPDWRESAARLRAVAASYGVPFCQAHAPFPCMKYGDTTGFNEERYAAVLRAIEYAALLGAGVVVVHPIATGTPEEEQLSVNLDFYRSLIPHAKRLGIRIALENMWGRSGDRIVPNVCSTGPTFRAYMDALANSDVFTACLDLGHCGLVGDNAADMIRALGPHHLTALHIHDNDGVHDTHTLPYQGVIAWDGVIDALREIGYTGNLTYEADVFLSRLPAELLLPGARFMLEVARHMRGRILAKE